MFGRVSPNQFSEEFLPTETVYGEKQENPNQTIQGFKDRTRNSGNPILHENQNHFLSIKVSWRN